MYTICSFHFLSSQLNYGPFYFFLKIGNLGFQCNTNPWQNQDDAYKEWMSFGACSPDKDMHPDADGIKRNKK